MPAFRLSLALFTVSALMLGCTHRDDPGDERDEHAASAVSAAGTDHEAGEADEDGEQDESAESAQVTLPAAVTAAFQKTYPNARVIGSAQEQKDGQLVYEVESMDGTQRRDLIYGPDGALVEYEEAIAASALPAAVAQAVQALNAGAVVTAERLVHGAETRYEVVVGQGTARREVVFTAEGHVVEMPAEPKD